jgi:hypothetical protein
MEAVCSAENFLPTISHHGTSQKTIIDILIAVRTPNLILPPPPLYYYILRFHSLHIETHENWKVILYVKNIK